MAVTYYVALPFIRQKTVPRQVKRRSAKASRRDQAGRGMSRDPANAERRIQRAGDPNVGDFSTAVVLEKFGRCAGKI